MKLITEELRKALPTLYSQENEKDPMVVCKFFLPMTKWTWYATEFDGKDTFFGFVSGEYPELGYFTRSELQELKGPMGLSIERDMYFEPTRLSTIRAEHEQAINPDTMGLLEAA
jgi:hypothetical protein